MSPADSLGLKRNSFVLPLTNINLRLILSLGMLLAPIVVPGEGVEGGGENNPPLVKKIQVGLTHTLKCLQRKRRFLTSPGLS